jgi:putative redox protein
MEAVSEACVAVSAQPRANLITAEATFVPLESRGGGQMAIGTRIVDVTERARVLFTRRPAAARVTKAATARQVGDRWQTEVRVGAHLLVVDQPTVLGGDDAGPNPGDLIRAALAACLAQTYTLHAARFGVVLHGVEVAVETEIDLRAMCGLGMDQTPGFGAVRYTTTLTTDAPVDQVQELVAYVERINPTLDDLRRGLDVTGRLEIRAPSPAPA